jgi:hypothetical protein
MADMHGVAQFEMFKDGVGISGVMIHVMAFAGLARSAMATAIMGDNAVSLVHEVEQLSVPIVSTQRPAVVKDDGLRIAGTPVLVEDLDAVRGGDCTHASAPFGSRLVRRKVWITAAGAAIHDVFSSTGGKIAAIRCAGSIAADIGA